MASVKIYEGIDTLKLYLTYLCVVSDTTNCPKSLHPFYSNRWTSATLRTLVPFEDRQLMSFQQLDRHDRTSQAPKERNVTLAGWVLLPNPTEAEHPVQPTQASKLNLLRSFRHTIDHIEVRDTRFAHSVCKLVPAQCPFERDVKLFGKTLFHIPPLCKLNPFYEEVVGLRFRALCYLADECGEDISCYC